MEQVILANHTPEFNKSIYLALHQCYSPNAVCLEKSKEWDESDYGEKVVRLCQKHGHYSPLEFGQLTFNVIGYPHNVVAQVTRHRHLSFCVQSFRYTGGQLLEVDRSNLEEWFYFRPLGSYHDRHGTKYEYTEELLELDKEYTLNCVDIYRSRVMENGYSFEHAREVLPYNFRQHFMVSMNLRGLLHLLDMRTPKDAQMEIRDMANKMYDCVYPIAPEIMDEYLRTRFGKNKLAP